MAETVETFTSRRSFLAHMLAKRFTGGGASEAGAWTAQQTGSALLRRASESLHPRRAMPSSWPCRRTSKKLDPDFARRSKLQLLKLQLSAIYKRSHTLPRALTFDMRGAQKAQPFVGPLDGKVRARLRMQLFA